MVFSIIIMCFLSLMYVLFKLYETKYGTAKYGTITLIFFIAIGIALNLFLLVEYLGPVTSPNTDAVFYEMLEYYNTNNFEGDVLTNDEGVLLHINNFERPLVNNQFYMGKYLESYALAADMIKKNKHAILLFNFPPVEGYKGFSVLTDLCELDKEFESKGFVLGYIYVC